MHILTGFVFVNESADFGKHRTQLGDVPVRITQ